MFRELGLPIEDGWADQGQGWINQRLRGWVKEEAGPTVAMWEKQRLDWEKAILRTTPDSRFHLAAMSLTGAARVALDQELLVMVGQAEELNITWTAIAEALATSPQNAHKVFSKRLMAVRSWVSDGWDVQRAVQEFYRRKS